MTLDGASFLTEAQLWNCLARQFGAALALESGKVVLSETSGPGSSQDPVWSATFAGPVSIVLTEFPFGQFAGVDLSLEDVRGLPPVLSQGLLQGALDVIRDMVPKPLASNVTNLETQNSVGEHEVWLKADFEIAQGRTALLLGMSRSDAIKAVQLISPAPSSSPIRFPTALLDKVDATLRPIIGRQTLALRRLRELKRGDVLLPKIDLQAREFVSDSIALNVHRQDEDDGASPWIVKETTMTDETDLGVPHSEQVSMENIPVSLAFSTEQKTVPLKELFELAAGSIFDLNIEDLRIGLQVKVLANGAEIGRGHLIQLDDSFAIRIDNISSET